MRVLVKKIDPAAQLPRYVRGEEDAAIDLHTVAGGVILPGQGHAFGTGLAFAIPAGTVGLVFDRGGLAFNHSLTTLAGVLDPGYRGELKVMLFNLGKTAYEVQPGERIAQLIITRIDRVEIEETDELSETARGDKGFGSSGRL
jgi:dUTP pyrophosphatase